MIAPGMTFQFFLQFSSSFPFFTLFLSFFFLLILLFQTSSIPFFLSSSKPSSLFAFPHCFDRLYRDYISFKHTYNTYVLYSFNNEEIEIFIQESRNHENHDDEEKVS